MPRGHKRWIIAGLAVVLATSAAVVVLRTTKPGRDRANADRAGTAIDFGARRTWSGRRTARQSSLRRPRASRPRWTGRSARGVTRSSPGTWRRCSRSMLRSPRRPRATCPPCASPPPAMQRNACARSRRACSASSRIRRWPGVFEELLADKSPFVRQNAAWALGELAAVDDGRAAARHAVAELRHARSRDPAPDVRSAAKGALARLE